MRKLLLITLGATVALVAQVGLTDDPVVSAYYGSGVHAFYAGHFLQSHQDLTEAIEGGIQDPRAFYFRALAKLKLGQQPEADADFIEGARREVLGLGNYPVARSLERVQGSDRIRLEQYRTHARIAAVQQNRRASELRYSQIETATTDVLRRSRPEADTGSGTPRKPTPSPKKKSGDDDLNKGSDPFGDEGETDDVEMPVPEVTEEEDSTEMEEEPAPEDEKPIKKKAGDDPFDEGDSSSDNTSDQKETQMEEDAAESDNTADQIEQRNEVENSAKGDNAQDQMEEQEEINSAAEGDNSADQEEQQMERDSAAGDNQEMVEEVPDDSAAINRDAHDSLA
ncbi:MAG: hypothetical protein WCR23_07845 [Planctomycetota bacterium]|nr:MAG: hypothetical protein DWH94_03870 [Planctomycetota bacterium]